MQQEVTMSRFRPGLTVKDFNFSQCHAFSRRLGYALGYILLLLHHKGLKEA